MKVLLISGNRQASPEPPYPLGCAYLVTALRESGHEVAGLDLLFEDDPGAAIETAIREFGPEVVGLSMRNLDLLTYPVHLSEVPAYADHVRRIRGVTEAPIVMGGSGFSLVPNECLAAVGADVGIAGEAEVALPALLARIRLDGGLADDLVGKVLRSPPGVDLDRIRPDHEVFCIDRYNDEGSGGSLQTRRGCSLPCSYCSYPLIEGRRVRVRSGADTAREAAEMRDRWGIDHLTFVDSVFNHPEDHAMDVARAFATLEPAIRWTAFFHPVFEDTGLFALLARSGCEGLDLGVDSLSEDVLARMRKGFSPSEVVSFCDGCRTEGLRFNISLLFGAPGETPDTVAETIDCVRRCDPDSVTVGIGLRLYPGARVSEELVEAGVVAREDVGISTFYHVSEPVRESLVETLDRVARADSRWIVPGLEINYNPRFMKRLRRHGRKGPIWHLAGK